MVLCFSCVILSCKGLKRHLDGLRYCFSSSLDLSIISSFKIGQCGTQDHFISFSEVLGLSYPDRLSNCNGFAVKKTLS